MPQDTPATVAGTDAGHDDDRETPESWAPVNRRTMRQDIDVFRNLRMPVPKNLPAALELAALALEYYEHASEVATRTTASLARLDADTDAIRDRCIQAIMSTAAAELAGGVTNATPETQRVLDITGGRYSKTITGAKELADLAPAMVRHLDDRRSLAEKKGQAEKELGVARRRHATAITFAHAFTFATPDALATPEHVAAANSVARPDPSAGDSDAGSLAEATS